MVNNHIVVILVLISKNYIKDLRKNKTIHSVEIRYIYL